MKVVPDKIARGRSKNDASDFPMTSRSHSRSMTTGNRANSQLNYRLKSCSRYSSKRSGNPAKSLSRSYIHSKLSNNIKVNKSINKKNRHVLHKISRNGTRTGRSREGANDVEAKSPQPTNIINNNTNSDEDDRASYRTHNVCRSSQRSHKSLKSAKSQKLSRQMRIMGLASRTRSYKKHLSTNK